MNAIFHNDAENELNRVIREMAEHITWLKEQPNANPNTVQQRAGWLKTILEYRTSAQATMQQASEGSRAEVEMVEIPKVGQSMRADRFFDYEVTRRKTIQQAMQVWPHLY